jgi:hypothetical protein
MAISDWYSCEADGGLFGRAERMIRKAQIGTHASPSSSESSFLLLRDAAADVRELGFCARPRRGGGERSGSEDMAAFPKGEERWAALLSVLSSSELSSPARARSSASRRSLSDMIADVEPNKGMEMEGASIFEF